MRRNSTLVCVPVTRESVDMMLKDIGRAKTSEADLVEIKLDTLKNFNPKDDLKTLIRGSPLPTLFTFRPKWEGGQYDGDENKRLDTLRLAVELGADYVDIELQVAREFINSIRGTNPEKCKIIVSSHNYENTPSVDDLANLVATIQSSGADIVKIVTTALDITDVARIFRIIALSQVPIIGLVMGEKGQISRILSAKYGGFLTYATLDSGVEPPTMKDLLELFNFRNISRETKVFGLIGKPLAQSKSPFLYNAAFKSVGFDGVYVPFLADDAAKFLQTYSSPDFAAFSCTLPHKEVAVKCCDEVDPVAKSIGAVNLMIRRESDGRLSGYNTDYVGAITAIEDGLRGIQNISNPDVDLATTSPLEGKLFVVIGAGGAGKALAYGAKEKGARVIIANRTLERAKELADNIGGQALHLDDLENFHPEDGMILANATPVGMQPKVYDTPFPKQALRHYTLVFDAVYAPKMTRLLKEAEESGVTIVTGLEMFIGQAYGHYEGFTKLPAPKELFRKIMSNY